jgi:hypothetical protein
LLDGKVLVAGGVGRIVGITDTAELYDPATGSNQPTGSLNILRRKIFIRQHFCPKARFLFVAAAAWVAHPLY